MIRLDLHVHTWRSDGFFPPLKVWEMACGAGLEVLAITDHDDIGAFQELHEAGVVATRPRLIAGVEVSTSYQGENVHLLGYFPEGVNDELRSFVEEVQAERLERMRRAFETLRERGLDIDEETIRELTGGPVISRSHLAAHLVDSGQVEWAEVYQGYLSGEGSAVDLPRVTTVEAIERLKAAGGITSWAHPRLDRIGNWLEDFYQAGIDALEAHHRRYKRKETLLIEEYAREYGLMVSGGSDWHGRGERPLKGIRLTRRRLRPFLERLGVSVK